MSQFVKGHKASNTKSLNKTLAILSSFDETSPMQRTSDIAAKLDMNISTVSRHLNTMLDWGFLEREDATGYYYPGIEIVALAGRSMQSNDVYRHAFPEVHRLSHKYDVCAHMAVPKKGEVIHQICSCGESAMELLIPMGHRHPMHCSAMGRVFLAYLPPIKAQEVLKSKELQKYTIGTKIDVSEINQELIRTRKRGYCTLINELALGTGSLAAPVFNRNREPIAAVSISTSAYNLRQPQREQVLAKAVTAAASRISSKLGYYPK
ncbi:IclR family transcriptional regulator [Enterococcus florum]|uniref:IclR family transcriptional regulator n=1 Tax=Enterococcus florum TaxID=2480627 RepID=A0A4P5PLV8_9ENTE|nr:IclR family transcriptional regulator [Enterococcus florum]GCF94243.1 IclR family transcriptional regulator [Enterococcus florum]